MNEDFEKTMRVYRHDGKVEGSLGYKFFAGNKTNNLWYKIIKEGQDERGTYYILLVPDINIKLPECGKRDNFKMPKKGHSIQIKRDR
jgi:hypothetical protein